MQIEYCTRESTGWTNYPSYLLSGAYQAAKLQGLSSSAAGAYVRYFLSV
jgi:hypothetical protein